MKTPLVKELKGKGFI